ncbi:MAG: hypothetical protein KKA73_18845 [Chloroflexi bacterium]|nr:hypothetical protein [Chloroflexota bacterium]
MPVEAVAGGVTVAGVAAAGSSNGGRTGGPASQGESPSTQATSASRGAAEAAAGPSSKERMTMAFKSSASGCTAVRRTVQTDNFWTMG